jgi:iron complex outermembrane receptor protein
MLKKTRLSLAVGAAFSAGLVGFAPNALGQAAPTTPVSGQQLDRVEITGSLIRRSQSETSLPVTSISIDELRKAGVTTAEQAMSFIAENQSATNTTNSVGASNGAASFADLRGLGPARTLVLLNGQRVVNNPYLGVAVDLNTIPTVAIERIEVLRDGASAVYGTDAIAGVVNIITRKEYEGISVAGQGTWPSQNGGEQYSANITGGYGSLAKQGFNIFGGFSYSKQEELKSTDRDYTGTGLILDKGMAKTSGTSFPANYSQSSTNVSTNPTLPNCQPTASVLVPDVYGPNSCRYDYTQRIQLIPEQEQWSFFGRGTVALGANNQVFLEYFRAYNEVSTAIAPTPLTGLAMTPTNPFYPGNGVTPITNANLNTAANISVGWRMEPAGQRMQRVENTTDRVMLGLEGSGAGWTYNATGYYSGATVDQFFTNGYVSAPKIRDGMAGLNGAPFLNPFGNNTAAGTSYINSSKVIGQVQAIDGDIWGINLNGQREIFSTSAGPWVLALGGEYRKEEVSYTNNFTLIRQAASSGLELAEDAEGDRNVYALLAEINIPVLKTMEFNVAVRYDDYSDVGNNFSPKVSWRWQAMDNLLLRASYNQGFRAPTLYDIYSPNSITFTADAWDDPLLCPGGVPVAGADAARDCGQQFQSQQGGNKKLQPETSNSWSLGLVFDVTKNVSASVDYWNTKIDDTVGVIPETSIFTDPAKYANRYVRCSQLTAAERVALISTCGGQSAVDPLAYIVQTQENLGSIKAQGLDFSFQARSATEYGNFSLSMQGTYLLQWEQQLESGGPYYTALGVYSQDLGFPAFRWQHVIMAGWQTGPWSVNLFNRLKSSYYDQNLTEFGPPYDDNTVGGNSVWDLTGTWQGFKGLTVTAGVLNMFDEKAPFSNQGATFQVGYDPRFSAPLGRQYFVRLGYEFK